LTDEDFNEAVRQSAKVINYLLGGHLKAVSTDDGKVEKVA